MVLKLRYPAPNGWARAKCYDYYLTHTDDPFFSEEESEKQEALDFCNGVADGITCPVRNECLLFALTNNEKEGVWGGTSEITRKAIRKKYPPLKGGKPRDEWTWQSEKDALKGLDREQLQSQAGED